MVANRLQEEWQRTLGRAHELGLRNQIGDSDAVFDWIEVKYQEPHRRYHTLDHLRFLFGLRFPEPEDPEFAVARVMFFFFHDVVYDVPSAINERESADAARTRLTELGFAPTITEFVASTIERSDHKSSVEDPMQQLLLDADLAILGTEPSTYQNYVRCVREEYAVIPDPVWTEKRAEFLEATLEKPEIFQHPHFRTQLEPRARLNIARELQSFNTDA